MNLLLHCCLCFLITCCRSVGSALPPCCPLLRWLGCCCPFSVLCLWGEILRSAVSICWSAGSSHGLCVDSCCYQIISLIRLKINFNNMLTCQFFINSERAPPQMLLWHILYLIIKEKSLVLCIPHHRCSPEYVRRYYGESVLGRHESPGKEEQLSGKWCMLLYPQFW